MPTITQDIRTATIVIAANDSLRKNDADYVCDGTADDVEIAAAIAALPADGGEIRFLEGDYTLTSANMPFDFDTLAKPIIFRGAGIDATTLTLPTTVTMFDMTAAGAYPLLPHLIQDMTIIGTTGCKCIDAENLTNVKLSRVRLANFPTVGTFDKAVHFRFENVWFENCGNVTTSAFIFDTSDAYDFWFEHCTWEGVLGNVFEAPTGVSAQGFYFTKPKFEIVSGGPYYSFIITSGTGNMHNVQIDGGSFIRGDTVFDFSGYYAQIIGVHFEFTQVQDIQITGWHNKVIGGESVNYSGSVAHIDITGHHNRVTDFTTDDIDTYRIVDFTGGDNEQTDIPPGIKQISQPPISIHKGNWGNTDGLSTNPVGTGAITLSYSHIELDTGITNPSSYTLYDANGLWTSRGDYDTQGFAVHAVRKCAAITNSMVWCGLWEASAAAVPVATEDHAAFKIVNGALWASSADAATEETTDLSITVTQNAPLSLMIITYPDRNEFWCRINDGVIVRVATHSTRLCSGILLGAIFYVGTTDTVTKTFDFYPYWHSKGRYFGENT